MTPTALAEEKKPRRIGVCVDDFGMHWGINSAAIELVDAGVVSAIGCMPLRQAWSEGALRLRRVAPSALDVGLHLDIAPDGQLDGREPPLPLLHLSSYLRTINAATVRQQIRRQFDEFERHLDRLPVYVDGHRHVHQLPVVRDLLLQEIASRYGSGGPWLRSTGLARVSPKALLIRLLGGPSFDASARRLQLRTSGRLLGVYGFDADPAGYWKRLRAWMELSRAGDVLMCHPARCASAGDGIARAREAEFEVLRSRQFMRLLQQQGITVAPPSQWL